MDTTEQAVLADIKERDRRDSERPISPLRPAHDALLLDTTELDIEKAFAAAVELIDKVAGRR
jgi:cytidylate kinase